MTEQSQDAPFRVEVRMLFQGALAIFLVTVLIGVLNGLDLVTFERPTLLTHAHAGTLGWITLGVFAASLWLFGEGQPQTSSPYLRWLSLIAIVSVALYVLTFFLANVTARPVTGALVLLVIIGFLGWVVAQSRRVALRVPHLAVLAALTTLTIGAVLGVLMQLALAGRANFLPQGAFVSHGATMVAGFLILGGMAITEWRLRPSGTPLTLSRAGIAQVGLPFLGGLSLMVGALLDVFILTILVAPLQVAGVIIYLWRLGPRIFGASWLTNGSNRLFALSALFLMINVAMIAYLVVNYASRIDEIPSWLIFALDHSVFIGVMTNGIFGLIYEASRQRRSLWPWADHLVFWGVNIGLIGFVAGLMLEEAVLKRIFSPIMGTSILLAMAVFAVRLQPGPGQATPAVRAEAPVR